MDVTTAGSGAGAREERRLAVASNLRLLEETVTAALAGAGHHVVRLPWPRAVGSASPAEPAAGSIAVAPDVAPDVLVIVGETLSEWDLPAVRSLLEVTGGRSLVVVGSQGAFWGALLEAGADGVLPASISIVDLLEAIESLARGDEVVGFVERQNLLRQWFALRADQIAYRTRLERLTPREREVLDLLHSGASALRIADRLNVSETTVRSQIRAVLRKLGVRSQLAAVAVLEAALGERDPEER